MVGDVVAAFVSGCLRAVLASLAVDDESFQAVLAGCAEHAYRR